MAESIKHAAIQAISSLPDDADWEDVLYTLYVREQIEAGFEDIRRGRTVSHDEVKRQVAEWRKSAGR